MVEVLLLEWKHPRISHYTPHPRIRHGWGVHQNLENSSLYIDQYSNIPNVFCQLHCSPLSSLFHRLKVK
jgi:hypothetical protein